MKIKNCIILICLVFFSFVTVFLLCNILLWQSLWKNHYDDLFVYLYDFLLIDGINYLLGPIAYLAFLLSNNSADNYFAVILTTLFLIIFLYNIYLYLKLNICIEKKVVIMSLITLALMVVWFSFASYIRLQILMSV